MASLLLRSLKHRFQRVINVYHLLIGWVYVFRYGWPSQQLTVIGVTGTDGKTTTSHLVYEFLKRSGMKVALISSVGAFVGNEKVDTGFHVTSPDARSLQPLLRKIKELRFTHVVLEITSHGLDQNRLVGIAFETAVLTNITPEHLDYHGSFENYRNTKMKLFYQTKYAVLNRDDPSFRYFRGAAKKTKIIPYVKSKTTNISPSLVGSYNLYNIAAAASVAKIYGVPNKTIKKVIKTFKGVPGRREEIKLGQKFRVIIDFAHTPNALNQLLAQLNKELSKNKNLILVFGCAGLRDHKKRPLMGRIAHRLANLVIITAEDPRTEKVANIFQQIISKTPPHSPKIIREDDRQRAINLAVRLAKTNDIVVITGKGNEKSICFGTIEFPWSDQNAVKKAIKLAADG